MPLTELIIDGFKSFAEKTTIHFEHGISGIVGPNGSGKSNITEAIRWAMGESSAKSLRGNNMKDVIFAGSEFRKPLNRAQVTLVFDNKDRQLNFENDQVAITRRILRSGDSDYLINNQSVRLKDVRSLFLDSGISQNSLAIISQGRVDQILNSRPEERRDIFEEAAGVLHFKSQKESAKAQLDKTNDNLIRINDLVKELASRLEPLHEQSSLAKEYRFQKKGLDEKLKTLLAFEIQNLAQKKNTLSKKAEQNQKLLAKLDQEVRESQSAVTQKRNEYKRLQANRDQTQNKLLQISTQISEINTNLQVAEQSKQYDEATKAEYQSQLTDLKKTIALLTSAVANLEKDAKEISAKKAKLVAEKDKLTSKLNEDPAVLSQKLETSRNEYIQLLQDQTSNNNQIVYLKSELKRTSEDTSLSNHDLKSQLEKAKASLETLKTKGKSLTKTKAEKENQIKELTQESEQASSACFDLKQQTQTLAGQLQKMQARKDALVNIQKRHEGYYYGVRNVLNHLENYPGVIGAVGELITFDSKYEAAMTTALGGAVQDLVTESKMAAKNAINTLKKRHEGRATFLPLDSLRQYTIPASTVTSLKTFAGFCGIASDLVSFNHEQDLTSAINYLLGSVIIVDNIENATRLSSRINRYRIVTLDGDVISPGGSMTGGVKNQRNNSPLQTTAEINLLKAKLKQLKADYEQKLAALSQKDDALNKLNQELSDLKTDLQTLKQEINEVLLSYQSQEKEVKRLEDANRLFEARQKEQADSIKAIKEKLTDAQNKQETLSKTSADKQNEVNELKKRIENFNSLNEKIQNGLAKLSPEIAVYANQLTNIQSQEKEKNLDLADKKAQVKAIEEKLGHLRQTKDLSKQKKSELEKKQTALSQEKQELTAELNDFAKNLGQFDAKINKLDQVASRNYDLRKDAADEQEQYSVELAKLTSAMNQKLDTLSQDYSLTYEAALSQATLENTPENREKLQRSVKLHKMSLDDIGPVNLDAIDEYDKVKTRYDFLNGQQDDLLSARKDLEQSMSELDQEVKSRFSATFDKISKHFSKIFPIVFGGGNAKLVLTEPDNMLETGIEIIAQPPGKKLQRLSLLSGGERALTAITLLFAMLEVNPVPFCVLDEVEAALDDANVARFARFLQKYDLHTQFIVITHRRGTMMQANKLFGVVMQEMGVSKVVSVSLKDIKDEVKE